MTRNGQMLTPNESLLAERYYHLIEMYMQENCLDEDEYYDILALGYLEGIKKYCRQPEWQGYSLVAVVNKAMTKSVSRYDRYSQQHGGYVTMHSMQDYVDSAYTLEERIADVQTSIDAVIDQLALEEIMCCFNATQQRIARLLMQGYDHGEVARLLNVTVAFLTQQLTDMQNKMMGSPLMRAA